MNSLKYLLNLALRRLSLFLATVLRLDSSYRDLLRGKLERLIADRKNVIAAKGAPPVFRKDGQVHNFSISGTTRTDFVSRRGKLPKAPARNVGRIADITEYSKAAYPTDGPAFPFVDPTDTGTLWLVRAKYKEEHLARRLKAAQDLLEHNLGLQRKANSRFEHAKLMADQYPENRTLAFERDSLGTDLFHATTKVTETVEYVSRCQAEHDEAHRVLQTALGIVDMEIPTKTETLGYDLSVTTAKAEGKL